VSVKKEEELTLEDVELAIKILETFIRRVERARSVLRRLGSLYGEYKYHGSMEDFIKMAMEMTMTQKKGAEAVEEIRPTLTEEEKQRLEKLKQKLAENR